MTQAAGYIRVSTSQQADQYGPEIQRRDIVAQAAADGCEIIEWYEDHHSGLHLWTRPEMGRLMSDFHSGRFEIAYFWRTDRLSRDPLHVAYVLTEAAKAGVEIRAIHDTIEATDEGGLIQFIKGFVGKKEVEAIKQRTQAGRKARARAGKLTASKRPTYGFKFRDATRSAYDIDEATAPIVVRIFEQKAAGQSLRKIAADLTAAGIPTATGGHCWNGASVSHLLVNERYTGRAFAWKGEIELPAGTVPRIISDSLFEAANQSLKAGRANAPKKIKRPDAFLLRNGYCFCGHCGRQMGVKDGYRQYIAADGSVIRYDQKQYCCNGNKGHRESCDGRPKIISERLDQQVWERVIAPLRDVQALSNPLDTQSASDPVARSLATVQSHLANTARKRNNRTRRLADVDDDDLATLMMGEIKALTAHHMMLETEEANLLERQRQWQTQQSDLSSALAFVEAMRAVLDDTDALTNDDKRLLLTALGVKVIVFKSGHEPRFAVTASIPLDISPAQDMLLAPTGTDGVVSVQSNTKCQVGRRTWVRRMRPASNAAATSASVQFATRCPTDQRAPV